MRCSRCNAEIPAGSGFCPLCGAPVAAQEKKANVGLAVLSFFIPLVGLILYIVKKDSEPKTAKLSGKCALVSVILSVVLSVIAFFVFIGASVALFDDGLDSIGDISYYEVQEDGVDSLTSFVEGTPVREDEDNADIAAWYNVAENIVIYDSRDYKSAFAVTCDIGMSEDEEDGIVYKLCVVNGDDMSELCSFEFDGYGYVFVEISDKGHSVMSSSLGSISEYVEVE